MLVSPAGLGAFERVGAITLESGEDNVTAAAIDPAGGFAYFGTDGLPGRVVKIDLATFERVGAIMLEGDDGTPAAAVVDPVGEFAYFGTFSNPGRLVKVDLETFARVGSITLGNNERFRGTALMDPAGQFAYFVAGFGRTLERFNLETFGRAGSITLGTSEHFVASGVMDPAGAYAYLGLSSGTAPNQVVKIDLDGFEVVDAITLGDGDLFPVEAEMDPAGDFAYFATGTDPIRMLKIDLETFEQVGSMPLDDGDTFLGPAVIDPAGKFVYLGIAASPGRVIKFDLEKFERVDALTTASDEIHLNAAVIDPGGVFAYFGTSTIPGRVVKILLRPLAPAALAVDPEPMASADGNGIFEPGETVDVAPAWRNNGAAPLGVMGTASGFTGPPGATYTLAQDSADYGTLDPDQTASCLDTGSCYVMGLNDPAARPATHWEATFGETLDDSDGTARTWTLHIGDSFTDVSRGSLFYSWIETLLHSGVTDGCDDADYCPAGTSTRGQMPAFVLRALLGPDFTPEACVEGEERFDDVPADNQFCPWIEELAARGVVQGCTDDTYCPSRPVTRAQMAIFLLKTLEGADYTPPECSGVFADVDCPSIFADWVEELFRRGVTEGCGESPLRYCPGAPNTRGQMAVFLSKTFGLTLYGP